MSFYINFNIDGDVDDSALEAIAATCDNSFDAEIVRKYKTVCTLGGSAWHNGYDLMLRATDAVKVEQEKPKDDDYWYDPPTYVVDARKLLAFLTMVKPLKEGVIGKAIDLANDNYDGVWVRASDICERLGIVPVDARLGDVAASVDKVGHVEYVGDDADGYEANIGHIWHNLADKLVDAATDGLSRGDIVNIVTKAMQSVYAYCTDSRDSVVVPSHLVDEALDEMRKLAVESGIDASCADDLLDFVLCDGWKIDNMLYEARHVRAAVDNGIDKLRCVI